jgi:uroporphyrinogen-III synthase
VTRSACLQRLIVTRPAFEAARWVAALQNAGWPAQALPLIEVAVPQDPALQVTLDHWRQHWHQMDALMFVSPAAVQHFFTGVAPAGRAAEGAHTRFWAPGPGTARALAQALQRLGVPDSRIDTPALDAAQFDSEALWPVVQAQLRPGHQLLIVRGRSRERHAETGEALPDPTTQGPPPDAPPDTSLAGNGRDWLIRQCEGVGVRVQACVAYERRAPAWGEADRQRILAATTADCVWLFSSSEALDHLSTCAPDADWSRATALATHPRIAQRARDAGFGAVVQARPALSDVLGALESGWSHP